MRFKIVILLTIMESYLMNQIQRMEMINQNKIKNKSMMDKKKDCQSLPRMSQILQFNYLNIIQS